MGAIWFFSLGGLGVFFPYYGLYLHENAGLDPTQVGIVYAVLPTIGLLAQPFWGQFADRTGSRSRVLTLLAAGTAIGYAAPRRDSFGCCSVPPCSRVFRLR